MKAITVYQPWASLLACEIKRFETRGWATKYRGAIAIHAGKSQKYCGTRNYQDVLITASHFPKWVNYLSECAKTLTHEIPFGAVIATAEIVGCYEIFEDRNCVPYIVKEGLAPTVPTQDEVMFGDWTPGRYAWEMANVKVLETPIYTRGMQGLWNWTPPEGWSKGGNILCP